MRIRGVTIVALSLALSAFAGETRTGWFQSVHVDKQIQYIVVVPDNYDAQAATGTRYPVLYLLHCAGCDLGSYNRPGYCPPVEDVVDSVHFIFAAPYDGGVNRWWLDAPAARNSDYSSMVTREFKPLVDSLYATLPDHANTGAAGHSMGGYGALHNYLEHPEIFGLAFSIKGGLHPRPDNSPPLYSYSVFHTLLGTDNAALYDSFSVVVNASRLADNSGKFGFYSGRDDDWFHGENQALHDSLNRLGIAHTYWSEAGEDHRNIPQVQMDRIMTWFDTSFSYQSQNIQTPPAGRGSLLQPAPVGWSRMLIDAGGRVVVESAARAVHPPSAGVYATVNRATGRIGGLRVVTE